MATETKGHTPGPWIVDIDQHMVSECISDLFGYAISGDEEPPELDYANAALIAAAPETAAERDRLRGQIDQLADFIMAKILGEPSQSQGSVDTAIRIMTNQQAVNAELLKAAQKVVEDKQGRLALGVLWDLESAIAHAEGR